MSHEMEEQVEMTEASRPGLQTSTTYSTVASDSSVEMTEASRPGLQTRKTPTNLWVFYFLVSYRHRFFILLFASILASTSSFLYCAT